MATRAELVEAVRQRYRTADRLHKGRILDEFVAVTGFHRKHAMRLLRGSLKTSNSSLRPNRQRYDKAVWDTLVILWEAADRICGKRLRPLIPILLEAMERHGHLTLDPELKSKVTAVSAATIDRALRAMKAESQPSRRQGIAGSALRRSVPIRTFDDWNDPSPGYVEADLVSHSGPVAKGSFVWTFTLTDIATGWTECAPLVFRDQAVVTAVLDKLRTLLPFPLLGFDTDNDSVFINETVRDYCKDTDVCFTRSRPYRKNDQAWVEQKNGSVVRRFVGYRRYEGMKAAEILADLYASARMFINYFQPSFKLSEKHRDGAKVYKRYHAPATPYQRLIDDPQTDKPTKARLRATFAELDPVRLLRDIRTAQSRLVALADGENDSTSSEYFAAPSLDVFLSGLRVLWQSGGARPTAADKPRPKRERRRPDPLVLVTEDLRQWFNEEPWLSGRDFLERLQALYPDQYADGLIRTVQRRLKIWRAEQAQALVFGGSRGSRNLDEAPAPRSVDVL